MFVLFSKADNSNIFAKVSYTVYNFDEAGGQ